MYSKGLLLGSKTYTHTYFMPYNKETIFTNKSYFNKSTYQILIVPCFLSNEQCEVISDNMDILLLRTLYYANSFRGKKVLKTKYYVRMNGVVYMHNRDLKRVPREISMALKEYDDLT